MKLIKQHSEKLETALASFGRQFRQVAHDYKPLELGEYCADDLEELEYQAHYLTRVAEEALRAARYLETCIEAKCSALWAQGPEE